MSPPDFQAAYESTALEVSAGTGIDPAVLLAQWANETDWGNVVVGNNLGNIRCSSTTFCRYASLGDFAYDCIQTWHNGYYSGVLAAVTPEQQLAAICASPWSSGHYGGSLQAFYTPLDVGLTPDQDVMLKRIDAATQTLMTPYGDKIIALVEKIDAAIAALPGASGGLTAAQAGELAGIAADVATVKRLIEKDLAP